MKYYFLFVLSFVYAITNAQDASSKKFRISVNAGYGYRFASVEDGTSSEERDLINQLRSGFNVEVGGSYFIGPKYGIGATFNTFSSNATAKIGDETNSIEFEQKDRITYIGPYFLTRVLSNDEQHMFITTAGLGYIKHVQNFPFPFRNEIITSDFKGSSIGYQLGVAYDYLLSEYFAIGAKIDLIGGSIDEYESDNLTLSSEDVGSAFANNLIRINISLGVRIYL